MDRLSALQFQSRMSNTNNMKDHNKEPLLQPMNMQVLSLKQDLTLAKENIRKEHNHRQLGNNLRSKGYNLSS